MTTCDHVARKASDYLEHRLGFGERIGVWTHLLVCSACKAYVEQVRLAAAALKSLQSPVSAPGEAQMDSLMQAFRAESKKPPADS